MESLPILLFQEATRLGVRVARSNGKAGFGILVRTSRVSQATLTRYRCLTLQTAPRTKRFARPSSFSTTPAPNQNNRPEDDNSEGKAKAVVGDTTSSQAATSSGSTTTSESSSKSASEYWRQDYKTEFSTEELLQKAKEAKAKEGKVSFTTRVVDGVKHGVVTLGNMTIWFTTGALHLLTHPSEIPGRLDSLWKTIKHEAYDYWIGFKLMGKNIGTAASILLTALQGKRLTRRERRMLRRTAVDIFRLVPFSIFIIIPFMEFLLPVALRMFPNMLPSSFKKVHEREDKLKKDLQARLQMASFLQETVNELAKSKLKDKDEKENVAEMLGLVRKGHRISNDQILKVAKVFNDEITLENMHRPQLVSLCQYMGLRPYGSNPHLRWVLQNKMMKLHEDDELIAREGVESLTVEELRDALQARGMRTVGLTPAGYRRNLKQWLNLSLNREVPLSLLILSRAFTILETRREEALSATLSALEEDTVEEVLYGGGLETNAATKLEVLERQNELISEESIERAEREERRRKIAAAKQAEAEAVEAEKAAKKEKDEAKEVAGAAAAAPDTVVVRGTSSLPQSEHKTIPETTTVDDPATVLDATVKAEDIIQEETTIGEKKIVIPDSVLEEAVEDLEALLQKQAVQEERDVLEALKRELQEDREEELLEGAVVKETADIESQAGLHHAEEKEKKKEEAEEGKKEEAEEEDIVVAATTIDSTTTDQLKAAERELSEEVKSFSKSLAVHTADQIQEIQNEEEDYSDVTTEIIADRLKGRVEKMLANIEKRIEDADKQMEKLNVLDTDGDGLITEQELKLAIKDVRTSSTTPRLLLLNIVVPIAPQFHTETAVLGRHILNNRF